MFTVIYIFRVSRANGAAFLRIQKEAEKIYKYHDALDDETLAPFSLDAKYGCGSFSSAVDIKNDEEVYIGLSRFKSRTHHDEVMAKVDADERIDKLYTEMLTVIDMARTLRGEFERVD
jgi:uncharacterized protein YbaA (DUF1428 family)